MLQSLQDLVNIFYIFRHIKINKNITAESKNRNLQKYFLFIFLIDHLMLINKLK